MANNQRMRRMALVLLALGYAATHAAAAETYFGFSIGISNAPPPPRIIVADTPKLIAVSGTSVHVVGNTDYDVFAYRSSYYCYSSGFWYRATSLDGPYAVVDVRSVPQPILVVPAEHWKRHPHGGPPGQVKKKKKGRG